MESSTFTAEFIVLKTDVEMLNGLFYKLRMLGVPISGPARVFCDNQSFIKKNPSLIQYLRNSTAQQLITKCERLLLMGSLSSISNDLRPTLLTYSQQYYPQIHTNP